MTRSPARRDEPAPLRREELLALSADPAELDDALYKRSGLPRRANLPLVDLVAETLPLAELRRLSDAREDFLAMCGAAGLALAFGGPDDLAEEFARDLDTLAVDPRWRVRDAVARGLQKGADSHPEPVIGLVEGWSESNDVVLLRTAVETISEPRVLAHAAARPVAAKAYRRAMSQLTAIEGPLSPEQRSLAATMSYAWGNLVLAAPDESLPLWHEVANDPSPVAQRIVADNLAKTPLGRLLAERG